MLDLIEKLDSLNQNDSTCVMTVIESAGTGDKAIFSAGRLIWESSEAFSPGSADSSSSRLVSSGPFQSEPFSSGPVSSEPLSSGSVSSEPLSSGPFPPEPLSAGPSGLTEAPKAGEGGLRASSFFSEHEREAASFTESGFIRIAGKDVFVEKTGSRKKLLICGAGHVGQQLIRLGLILDMELTVFEDREFFAARAGELGADKVFCGPYKEILSQIEGSDDSYFVVLTHGHRSDLECMREILKKRRAYAGMIGSKRHGELIKKSLAAEGVAGEILDEIRTPVGLKIGALTPAEIAVSIAGQIIEEKNREPSEEGFTKEIIEAILRAAAEGIGKEEGNKEKNGHLLAVMATILKLEGSGPRKPGAKMAVFPGGKTAGSIGGGLGEARAVKEAEEMLKCGQHKAKILKEVMTAAVNDSDGMVCGGKMKILLEPVY